MARPKPFASAARHFTRQPDESWTLRIFGLGEKVQLGSLGCAIDVDQV